MSKRNWLILGGAVLAWWYFKKRGPSDVSANPVAGEGFVASTPQGGIGGSAGL